MKIGLYSGSFNPIHHGHVMLANYLVEFSDLDELWFVVSPQNPLKKKADLMDDNDRLEMVKLAIGDDPRMRASDIEFSLPQPSYTTRHGAGHAHRDRWGGPGAPRDRRGRAARQRRVPHRGPEHPVRGGAGAAGGSGV